MRTSSWGCITSKLMSHNSQVIMTFIGLGRKSIHFLKRSDNRNTIIVFNTWPHVNCRNYQNWSDTTNMHAFIFQLYIQSRITWKGSRLLRHFMQVICMYMTIYTCCSRVSDYKHHWSDVLVGFLLGSLVAIITVSDLKRE